LPPAPGQKSPAAPPPKPDERCSATLAENTDPATVREWRLPARCSFGDALIDQPLDALELHARDDGANVDGFIERRTHSKRVHAVLNLADQLSAMLSCISRREPAQQTCPWLNQMPSTRPSTALSKSASSKMTKGDLPPSSREKLLVALRRGLANRAPNFRRTGERNLVDVGMFHQCFAGRSIAGNDVHDARGEPASWQICANASAVRGVNSAGFSTTVFPVASAGAIFHASMSNGKFHGMIWPTTPQAVYPGNSCSSNWAQPA